MREDGNMIFIILLAVALIGALTAAILSGSNTDSANIDEESLALKAGEVQRYASELERGVHYVLQNGTSESAIRFAHDDAPSDYGTLGDPDDRTQTFQVFHRLGGAAGYRAPPSGIQTSTAGNWEFYGTSHIPGIGTSLADLIAVLPNVTPQFCAYINQLNDQPAIPSDPSAGGCIHAGAAGRFDGGTLYAASPNEPDASSFAQNAATSSAHPAPQACVQCAGDSSHHFYHVLLAR